MFVNLINKDFEVHKSWILLYNTNANEKFENEVKAFNSRKNNNLNIIF